MTSPFNTGMGDGKVMPFAPPLTIYMLTQPSFALTEEGK